MRKRKLQLDTNEQIQGIIATGDISPRGLRVNIGLPHHPAMLIASRGLVQSPNSTAPTLHVRPGSLMP